MEEILKLSEKVSDLLRNKIGYEELELYKLQPGDIFKTDVGEFIVLEQKCNCTLIATNGLIYEPVDEVIAFDRRIATKKIMEECLNSGIFGKCNEIYEKLYKKSFNGIALEQKFFYEIEEFDDNGDKHYTKIKPRNCFLRPLSVREWEKYKHIFNKIKFEILKPFWTCTRVDEFNMMCIDLDWNVVPYLNRQENSLLLTMYVKTDVLVRRKIIDGTLIMKV